MNESGRALVAALLIAPVALMLQWPRLDPGTSSRTAASLLDQLPLLPASAVRQSRCLGWCNLYSDWLWLQYVQYLGDQAARERTGYGASADYAEAITALDPGFLLAYAYGGYATADLMDRPERALALLVEGARRNQGRPDTLGMPGTWFLWRLAASVSFRHRRDYARAALYFERAAASPGAPAVMKESAAAFYQAKGDRERAVRLWCEFAQEAPTPALRASALLRLRRLDGRCPGSAQSQPAGSGAA